MTCIQGRTPVGGVTSIEHAKAVWPVVLKKGLRREYEALLSKPYVARKAFIVKVAELGVESVSMTKLKQLAAKMKAKDVYLCPTLLVPRRFMNNPVPEGMPKRVKVLKPVIKGIDDVYGFVTRELAEAGVKLLVGHDHFDPEGAFDEMELLDECGVPEAEILKGATIHPANWLMLDDRLGSVAPGREANLVFLKENPLEDIKNVRSTCRVMQKGKVTFRKAP